jgi:hypothetical protein
MRADSVRFVCSIKIVGYPKLAEQYRSGVMRKTELIRKKYATLKTQELDVKKRDKLGPDMLALFEKLKVRTRFAPLVAAGSLVRCPILQDVTIPSRKTGGQRLAARKTTQAEKEDARFERVKT